MEQVRGYLHRSNLESYEDNEILGFLYFAYSDSYEFLAWQVRGESDNAGLRFWWYEFVYLVRKLLLNGVVIFIVTSHNQLIFSMFVCFVAVCLQLVRQVTGRRCVVA